MDWSSREENVKRDVAQEQQLGDLIKQHTTQVFKSLLWLRQWNKLKKSKVQMHLGWRKYFYGTNP